MDLLRPPPRVGSSDASMRDSLFGGGGEKRAHY